MVGHGKASEESKSIGAGHHRGHGDIRSFVQMVSFDQPGNAIGASVGRANDHQALAETVIAAMSNCGTDATVPGAPILVDTRPAAGATAKRKRSASTHLTPCALLPLRRRRFSRKSRPPLDHPLNRAAEKDPVHSDTPLAPQDEAGEEDAPESAMEDVEDHEIPQEESVDALMTPQDANGLSQSGATRPQCTVPGCQQPALRVGYCYRHQINRMPKPLLMIKACSDAGPQVLEKMVPVDILAFLESMHTLRGRFPPAEEMVLEYILAALKEPEACSFFARACKLLPKRFSEADLRLALLRTPGSYNILILS